MSRTSNPKEKDKRHQPWHNRYSNIGGQCLAPPPFNLTASETGRNRGAWHGPQMNVQSNPQQSRGEGSLFGRRSANGANQQFLNAAAQVGPDYYNVDANLMQGNTAAGGEYSIGNVHRGQEGDTRHTGISLMEGITHRGGTYQVGSSSVSTTGDEQRAESSLFSAQTANGNNFDVMSHNSIVNPDQQSSHSALFSMDQVDGFEGDVGYLDIDNGEWGEEGARREGSRTSAGVLRFQTPEDLPFGTEVEALSFIDELSRGEDGASLRVGIVGLLTTLRMGNFDEDQINDARIKISYAHGGIGLNVGIHHSDEDNDGITEYGFHFGGAILEGFSVDIKTEDPLRTGLGLAPIYGPFSNMVASDYIAGLATEGLVPGGYQPSPLSPFMPHNWMSDQNMTEEARLAAIQAWQSGKEVAGNAWEGAQDLAGRGVDAASTFAGNAWDATQETAGNVWEASKETAGHTVDAARRIVGNGVDAAGTLAGNAVNTAGNVADNVAGAVGNTANRVGNAAGAVGNAAGNAWRSGREWWKNRGKK